MKLRKLGFLLLIVLLGVSLLASGCAKQEPAATEKVVKIGLVMPLTGDVKTFGESSRNGFMMALEQANFKAGDYKIEYFIADDRNDATEAVNVTEKLISQDKVNAIVGPLTSKATIPASEVANAKKVVLISNTATNPKVTVDNGVRKPYIFRACFIDPFQGFVGAKFAIENLKAKTAAVMYDQGNDYTKGLAEEFKKNFEAMGGKIEAFEAYAQADVDFSAVLTNIAKKNVDVLYLPDYYQKVSLIGKQARDKGIKAAFLGGDGWDSPELDFKAMEGGYFTNHYHPGDTRPEVKKWVSEYKAKYGSEPDALATLAYDATNLLLNAIRTANSNDPEKIRAAMQATKNFPSVSGTTTFDENGNSVKAAAILQVKDGKQVFVTTVNP
ncbi:MAG: ABC transporter substrate-binding protein [Syntrophomonadaceae bacterium]|nr:ABC transporter substrate-binding protein [Syntrophomonadaceae bacterium]